MRIAQLAPLVEPIPPVGYGGTELVVSHLTESLLELGHDVTLFASGDSQTNAKLVSVTPHGLRLWTDIPIRRWLAYDIQLLIELQRRQDDFDLIHNHMGFQALSWLEHLQCPSVTTLHNPIRDYCAPIFLAYKDLNYISISNAYKRLNYPDELNYIANVYNGIEISQFKFKPKAEKSYLLFIGRLGHDKGTREAIEIAGRVGMPIKLAGKVDEADAEYFEQFVKPSLDDKDVQYLGEVDLSQKVELYGNAYAVIYPLNFDEPFGLVMVESLACGTPLLALDRGSVREILSDGETAVIGNSLDDLVERFSELEKISRLACHNRVAQLFSKDQMTANYLSVYEKVLGAKASPGPGKDLARSAPG